MLKGKEDTANIEEDTEGDKISKADKTEKVLGKLPEDVLAIAANVNLRNYEYDENNGRVKHRVAPKKVEKVVDGI